MNNYDRMLKLVIEFFGTRTDEGQITVSDEERDMLLAIHPSAMVEVANDDGPIFWLLAFPTTTALMQQFISGTITEAELLRETKPNDKLEAIYLCSAFTLPEFRHKGIGKKATLDAVKSIQNDYPINALFYWAFSDHGKKLAEGVAHELGLTLFEKNK